MSFERVFLRQRFRAERDYLVDWCWIALLAVVFLPWPVASTFPILAVILGSGLAVRFGGYPTRTRSWEYLLTRSISRERLVRALFVATALPLLAFCVFVAFADAIDLRGWVFSLFVDVEPMATSEFPIRRYLMGAGVALLLGSHVFKLAIGEVREEVLPNVRWNGTIAGVLFYGFLFTIGPFVLALGSFGTEPDGSDPRRTIEATGEILQSFPGVVAIAVLVAWNLSVAKSWVRRLELAGIGAESRRGTASFAFGIAIVLVVLVLLAFFFFVLRGQVAPAGK